MGRDIAVGPWPDSRTAGMLPIRHRAVEQFWLPVIGPTSLFMWRRLGTIAQCGRFDEDLALLALRMGAGTGLGRNSVVVRTIERLVGFHVARVFVDSDGYTLQVRTTTGPPGRTARYRWPEQLRSEYEKEQPWLTFTTE